MAAGKAKGSNGTRRLTGARKARYARYALLRPWEKRKIRNIMRHSKMTEAQASRLIRKPGKKAGRAKEARS